MKSFSFGIQQQLLTRSTSKYEIKDSVMNLHNAAKL
jgi:hypothetical protein